MENHRRRNLCHCLAATRIVYTGAIHFSMVAPMNYCRTTRGLRTFLFAPLRDFTTRNSANAISPCRAIRVSCSARQFVSLRFRSIVRGYSSRQNLWIRVVGSLTKFWDSWILFCFSGPVLLRFIISVLKRNNFVEHILFHLELALSYVVELYTNLLGDTQLIHLIRIHRFSPQCTIFRLYNSSTCAYQWIERAEIRLIEHLIKYLLNGIHTKRIILYLKSEQDIATNYNVLSLKCIKFWLYKFNYFCRNMYSISSIYSACSLIRNSFNQQDPNQR